jgi:lysozyme family protein
VSADFKRALAFTLPWEGGWSDNPADPGGATMHGITLATYTAWRAAHGYAAPSKAALREISDEEVQEIYWNEFWKTSGCEMLEWPLSLAHFDGTVNSGLGNSEKWLNSTHSFDGYMAARIDFLTRTNDTWWATFARGVVRRCADLIKKAAE